MFMRGYSKFIQIQFFPDISILMMSAFFNGKEKKQSFLYCKVSGNKVCNKQIVNENKLS